MRFQARLDALLLVAALGFGACGAEPEEPVVCGPPPSPGAAPFEDGTASMGIDFVHHMASDFCHITDTVGGPGVCAFDYDADGDLDLYFADRAPHPNRLYRNEGGHFTDVTEVSGAGDTGDGIGCLALDHDGDADLDLYVTNVGPDRLYRNELGHFTDATAEAGIEADGFSTSATAGDIDGDGDLDLFVARLVRVETCPDACHLLPLACEAETNLLLENRGGVFVDVTAERGLAEAEPTLASLFFDADGDGDLDIYAGNDMGVAFSDRLYVNDGSGRFVDRADAMGFSAWGTDTMGIDVGDIDADGMDDIVTTDFKGKPLRIYHCFDPALPCSFEAAGPESLPYVKWGVAFADFDQDRDVDIFTANGDVYGLDGDPSQLYWNDGRGRFTEHAPSPDEALALRATSRGAAFGDLDGDGAVDVVVANVGGPPQILLNRAARGHGLTVEVDPPLPGTRVTVETPDGARLSEQLLVGGSYLGSSDPRLHFGLGEACVATVSVAFPDGEVRTLERVPAGSARISR